MTQETLNFDGPTFVSAFDAERLTGQHKRVWAVMKDGNWRTLGEIGDATGDRSEVAISARLRDFRKSERSGHTVNRRRRGEASSGLFEYQVVKNGR